MSEKPQNFAHHTKFDPSFHFLLVPVFLLNIIVVAILLFRYPSLTGAWLLLISVALLATAGRVRAYATKTQDRIIRLEERLRLAQLLPEALRPRIGELSTSQLIALRFASDGELTALVMRALDEKLDRNAIKKAITEWRPDYQRV
ncbi:MAG TPA: DUF6526 family protein [Candidatus Angelobacter sp.]|nr:DUF6526 family protein [Candidatus Angelobacter sp.]